VRALTSNSSWSGLSAFACVALHPGAVALPQTTASCDPCCSTSSYKGSWLSKGVSASAGSSRALLCHRLLAAAVETEAAAIHHQYYSSIQSYTILTATAVGWQPRTRL
jgi:hypothetical protein